VETGVEPGRPGASVAHRRKHVSPVLCDQPDARRESDARLEIEREALEPGGYERQEDDDAELKLVHTAAEDEDPRALRVALDAYRLNAVLRNPGAMLRTNAIALT
jgi:hypothetical protein